MEYVIVGLGLLLIGSLILAYGEFSDNKELKSEIDDYEFCLDCLAKFRDSNVESVLVYESDLNTLRRSVFMRMGYVLMYQKEIPTARLRQLIKIQPGPSKIPSISIKECSQYPG